MSRGTAGGPQNANKCLTGGLSVAVPSHAPVLWMRPPKTHAQHQLQGTTPQTVLPNQSPVSAGRPKLPKNLPPAARQAFKDACRALEARRALTPGDAALLRVYALLVARHEAAIEKVMAQGLVATYTRLNSNGQEVETEKPNLYLKIAQDCERQLVAVLDRLGLSPRARDAVKPTAPRRAKVVQPGSVAWAIQNAAQESEEETAPETQPEAGDDLDD
jgi:phage terminase small subunit